MPDWTAITGIVVSGVLGPGLLTYYAGRRQQARLKHERSLTDLAELRKVLDQAAIASRRAMWGVESMADLLEKRFDQDEYARLQRQLEEKSQEAALASGQITLRLGAEHPVAERYEELSEVFLRTVVTLYELTRPKASLKRMPVNPWAVRNELLRVTKEAQPEFRAARQLFIEACSEFVGAEL